MAKLVQTLNSAQIVEATDEVSTSSDTKILVPNMTRTPGAGVWKVHFSYEARMDAEDNKGEVQLFGNGVAVASSLRSVSDKYTNAQTPGFASYCSIAIISVDAGQAIEARYERLQGTIYIRNRQLLITRA